MKDVKDYQQPAALADFIAQVGVDPSTGLSRDDAMARRALYGANRVTPPVNCPSWVCCLLPCLLRTSSMQAYHAVLPKEATVRRKVTVGPSGKVATRRMRMDAMSLVYGDVVELQPGDLVSADMRVIECSSDCLVDQSALAGGDDDDDMEGGERSRVRKHVSPMDAALEDGNNDPLMSRNILLMASRVVRGSAVAVVIATGDRTFWGQLVAHHEWPVPASTFKRTGQHEEHHRLVKHSATKSKSAEVIV
ncbi:Carbohydrate-binding protein, partial [Globisporangium splendens]